MDHDPQKKFEALFEKLEPWQQQWVACRAAMRVLPVIAELESFPFWKDPKTSLAALAVLPLIASFLPFRWHDFERRFLESAHDAGDAADLIHGFDSIDDAAYAVAYVGREDPEKTISLSVDALASADVFMGASEDVARRVALQAAFEDATTLSRRSEKSTSDELRTMWESHFAQPLWPRASPPKGWDRLVKRFYTASVEADATVIAAFVDRTIDGTLDFDETQDWLFGSDTAPARRRETEARATGDAQANYAPISWTLLLYRLELALQGQAGVLVDPSIGQIETAMRISVKGDPALSALFDAMSSSSTSTKNVTKGLGEPVGPRTIRFMSEWLDSKFGHLPPPPPLWRAWFQAVHGEKLREIQEHFAREAE